MAHNPAIKAAGLAAALLTLALCAACSGPQEPAGSSSSIPTTSASSGAPSTFGTGPQAPEQQGLEPPAPPTWSPESRKAAIDVAVAFMQQYARPNTPQPRWSQDLAPYASLDLQGFLAKADTSYLTVDRPAGTGSLQAEEDDAYNGVVAVETSEGTFAVTVHRQPDASWRVTAVQPPVKAGH